TALGSAFAANPVGAFQGLVSLLSGVGAGVMANELTGKMDEKQASEALSAFMAKIEGKDNLADAQAVLAALQKTPALREAADALLAQTGALALAEKAFAQKHPDDSKRRWFADAIQQALQQMGSRPQIQVRTGDASPVAIGKKAKALKDSIDLQGAKVKGNLHVHLGGSEQPATSSQQPQTRYLQNLHTTCNLLPLSALAGERDRHTAARMTLSDVYIDLNTTDRVDKQGKLVQLEARERFSEDDKIRPLSVLEAAVRNDALVILGDPGSGKSSFVNHLLACHAAKLLDTQVALPKAWPHGALLPVRILLRELAVTLQQEKAATWLKKSTEKCQQQLCQLVYKHLNAQLKEDDAADFVAGLRKAIADRRALFVFDGLDEAQDTLRSLVRYAVEAFCAHTKGNRFLVTCRILSYSGETQLQHFPAVTLAPFTKEQVDGFVERWYGALAQVESWPENRRQEKTGNLKQAVRTLPQTMVQNPMLLTTMANVHARNVKLPRQRVRLYKEASKVLLWRWQEEKEQSLFEEIGLEDDSKIFPALWEMGCEAQKSGGGQETADIAEGRAYEILKRHFAGLEKPGEAANKFLGFVDRTAGLLIGRGGVQGSVIAFPHRTFQEYFAGCWLAKGSGDLTGEVLSHLPRGDDWRLAAQLGVEEMLYNDSNLRPVLQLTYDLCKESEPEAKNTAAWRGIYWAALFVPEIGSERILAEGEEMRGGGKTCLDRLKSRLAAILESGLLPARERAEAGFALGNLGDPRPGVCSLPPVWIDLPRRSNSSRGEPGG
ncbi:MAG: NACHT domain-containing protein, partial [Methyloligellaceae bacterium]